MSVFLKWNQSLTSVFSGLSVFTFLRNSQYNFKAIKQLHCIQNSAALTILPYFHSFFKKRHAKIMIYTFDITT